MDFRYSLILMMVPLVLAQRTEEPHWHNKTIGPECCKCVPYMACNDDGQLVKPVEQESSINVQKCDSVVNVCCIVSGAPKNCSSFQPGPKAKVNKVPQPEKTCECTHWEACSPYEVVTDGKGGHSDMGLTTHSKCSKPLEVCCQNSHDHAGPEVEVRIGGPPEEDDCSCVLPEQCINGQHNTDGVNILEPRIRGDGKCANHEVFCCSPKNNGSGKMSKGNSMTLIGFVSFVAIAKEIILCH